MLLSIGRSRNNIRRFRLVGSAPNRQNSYTRQSPPNCRVPGNAKNEKKGRPAVFGTTSFFQPKPPTVTARALTDVWMLTLHHPTHDRLRRENPRAAEELALAVVRTLSERFDLLDKLFTDYIAHHPDAPGNTASEWSRFRASLFEEHKI